MQGLKNMQDKLRLICEHTDCEDCPANKICSPELHEKAKNELKIIEKIDYIEDLTLDEIESMLQFPGHIMPRTEYEEFLEQWEKVKEEERLLEKSFPY